VHESRPTTYASRRIHRPLPAVVADIETFLTRRSWSVVDRSGPVGSLGPSRAFAGFLYRESGTRIARVEVDVTAWSHDVTEVGVRPLGSRARRVATRRRYGDAVTVLLDQLVRRPVRPAAAPARTPARAIPALRRAS
jgi:hypothetical protein